MAELSKALADNHDIEEIIISQFPRIENERDSDPGLLLYDVISTKRQLRVLDLEWNRLSANAICKFLQLNVAPKDPNISKNSNKNVGKILYCDIFFSIDTIEKFIRRNKVNIYDHFNHLLIHSLLHINGYNHKKNLEFKKMKREEIKILGLFGINNPYTI